MTAYKIEIRNSTGWKAHRACTLGVSVTSPHWQGPKFAAILAWAAQHFDTIRISIADAAYRHHYLAQGFSPDEALRRAIAHGDLWLAQHQDMIAACPKPVTAVRWAQWYRHPDYAAVLAGFQRAHDVNPALRTAVAADVEEFHHRRGRPPTLLEAEHGRNFILEELAVYCLQGRTLPGARAYPSEPLASFQAVKSGAVPDAPPGFESIHYTQLSYRRRGRPQTQLQHKVA